ncbi:MAG: hypothetical protein ACLP56_18970 [Candidatus Sulfotelmatobacter sp.]
MTCSNGTLRPIIRITFWPALGLVEAVKLPVPLVKRVGRTTSRFFGTAWKCW